MPVPPLTRIAALLGSIALILGLTGAGLRCELLLLLGLLYLREAVVHSVSPAAIASPPSGRNWASRLRLVAWMAGPGLLALILLRRQDVLPAAAYPHPAAVAVSALAGTMAYILGRIAQVSQDVSAGTGIEEPSAGWANRLGTVTALRELCSISLVTATVLLAAPRWQFMNAVLSLALGFWQLTLLAESLLNLIFALCTGQSIEAGLCRESAMRRWLHGLPAGDEAWAGTSVLRSTGLGSVARRTALPLAVGLAGCGWLMTGLVVVRTDECAACFQLGRLRDEPLAPGLHLLLPRPLGHVVFVPAGQTRTLSIGFEADPDELARLKFSWTEPHGRAETPFLVGNGTELVALNGLIQYRVPRNSLAIREFVTSAQHPEALLTALAERVLTLQTRASTIDGLLTEDRAAWNRRLWQHLTEDVARFELGIEIVAFELVSIHPPIEVSTAYLDVVSARIDADKVVAETQAATVAELLRCETARRTEVAAAQAARALRLMEAEGELSEILTFSDFDSRAADVLRRRAYCETLANALQRRTLTLIDSRVPPDTQVWLEANPN